jgi:hypothetical protein
VCCEKLITVYVSLTGLDNLAGICWIESKAAAGVARAFPQSASRKALLRQMAYMCFVDDWTG